MVVGAFIAVASLQSYAAGLGRLDVKSVLGEPLRAEVAVSAKPDEVRSLQARLASPSAYEAAGLVYTDIVSQLSVTLKKDDGGEPSLTVTSSGPINEPVVDLLLELTWSSGRVTREYTAFIDPPFIVAERQKRRVEEEMAAADAARAARGAETRPAEVPDAPTPQPLPSAVAEGTAPEGQAVAGDDEQMSAEQAEAAETASTMEMEQTQATGSGPVETIGGTDPTLFTAAPTVSAPAASAPADTGMATDEYGAEPVIGVIRGDTLSSIALARKPDGVTLEQMLVVLFRNNPEAFSGNNMNRLRAGKVIRLPNPAEYTQLNVQQARKEVRVQYSDWNAYRERVAAAAMQQPADEQPAQQAAAGAVTPRIEDRAPAADGSSPEVVKLSRGEPAAAGQSGGQANVKALEEQLVASEKALQESNARVARLEKIIEDLQKLAEVENENMAQVQSQAATAKAPPAPAPEKMPAGESQPEKAPVKDAQPVKPEQAPQVAAAGSEASAPAKPESGAPAASPAKAPPPANPPQRRAPPPPPPSLVDQVMEQPYLLAVPVVILLLIGFGVSRLRKRKREAKPVTEEVAPAGQAEASGKMPASQSFSPGRTDTGVGGSGAADSDDVDPLEEAEIFMAYGRDAQAEELLKEAIESHPTRYEIHAKLAEIYAKRGDKKALEKIARDMQQGSGGHGEPWARVVALGYSLDPANPRYAEGKSDAEDNGAAASPAKGLTSTTDRIDFEVGLGDDTSGGSTDFDPSESSGFGAGTEPDLDATIDESFAMDNDPTTIQIRSNSKWEETDLDLSSDAGLTATDLDLSGELPGRGGRDRGESGDTTINLSMDADDEPEMRLGRPGAGRGKDDDAGLEFNMDGFSLDSGGDGEDDSDSSSSDMPALDLSGISLDFDGASGSGDKDEKWYEVQTKFDLAKAYQEMGDKDGAREILQEVITEGDSEQKAAAESVLASLD